MALKLRVTGNGQTIDAQEVRRSLSILADPRHAIQLQAAPHWRFMTFDGTDLDGMVAWCAQNSDATGIYYALNPVAAGLADRVKNADAVYRRWLLVDIDRAKSDANKELSATAAEHEQARLLTTDILEYLYGLNWPSPLMIDSGNGFHLLYLLDLPNSELAKLLVKAALLHLAEKWNDERGMVGAECHDARRISKLPGTWARRGPAQPDRPHRLARLLHAPDELQVVTQALLEGLTGTTREPGNGHVSSNGTAEVHTPGGIRLKATSSGSSEHAYAQAALERECGRMAIALPGSLNVQLYKSAAALGNFVGAGLLTESVAFDTLLRAAKQAGCDDPQKDEDTIRRGLDKGKLEPRKVPERVAAEHQQQQQQRQKAATRELRILRLPELLSTDFPEPVWAVPGLLSEGLTVLAGKPKLGKSWLALNLGLTIAAGGMALGTTKVVAGDVLYLSLEDRWRRIQDRAKKVLDGLRCGSSNRLHVAIEWPRQDQGGLEAIESWIKQTKALGGRPTLVIIDVWAKYRPTSKGGNRNAYEVDYEQVSALKAVMDDHKVSAMLIHHCKKAKADDALEEVSGTNGIAGSADGILVLTRARNENEAELFITGRDIEEAQLALEFNPQTFAWQSHGKAGERTDSKLKQRAIEIFKANFFNDTATTEIADKLQIHKDKREYFRVIINRMHDEGLIERISAGRFRWPVAGECAF